MEKTQKNILGFLGLLLVAATTVVAACLPLPGASATTSVTDTVIIRVVGDSPNVDVSGITSGTTTTSPNQSVNINYEHVGDFSVTLKYKDKDGTERTYQLIDDNRNYEAGSEGITFDLDKGTYSYGGNTYPLPDVGYGEYVLTATGEGGDGVKDEQSVAFTFIPVTATAKSDDKTGIVTVDLEYNGDDGISPDDNDVVTLVINVYDENGEIISSISPTTVNAPDTEVELPFGENNIPSGKYKIEVIAYNSDNEELYKYYYTYVKYNTLPVPDTGGDGDANAPDTGGLFKGLNIAKGDYLITGLGIFFLVGICGAVYIAKSGKKSSKRR